MARVTIDEQAKTVTIVMELQEPRASASGKTLVIASTRGNIVSDAEFNGRAVTVGCNCYIRR